MLRQRPYTFALTKLSLHSCLRQGGGPYILHSPSYVRNCTMLLEPPDSRNVSELMPSGTPWTDNSPHGLFREAAAQNSIRA